MNKEGIDCEIIQDLLPLYVDGVVSESSTELVEKHFLECESCKKKCSQYQEIIPEPEVGKEEEYIELEGIRRGVGQIKKWGWAGIVCLSVVLAFIFLLIPLWNYISGHGLTYANLNIAYTAFAFERALISGNYDKAYSCLDIEGAYEELMATPRIRSAGENPAAEVGSIKITEGLEEIEEKGFDWYNQVCREKFIDSMKILEENGEIIASFSNFRISRIGEWRVSFDAESKSGTFFTMTMGMTSEGINAIYTVVHSVDEQTRIEPVSYEELQRKGKMFDRLYREPSKNETVMELLYGDLWEWRQLFIY